MSEPCPPAFMRTAPPTDPGTPTAHESPDHPASATRRASTGRDNAAPARTAGRGSAWACPCSTDAGSGRSSPAKPEPRCSDQPLEPVVGHQQVRPAPDHEDGDRIARRCASGSHLTAGRPDGLEILGSFHLGEEGGRPADAVGGHRSERLVIAWPAGRAASAQGLEHRGGRHHDGESSRTSGSDVRSPAPRVKQRSPACRVSATASRSCSQAGA